MKKSCNKCRIIKRRYLLMDMSITADEINEFLPDGFRAIRQDVSCHAPRIIIYKSFPEAGCKCAVCTEEKVPFCFHPLVDTLIEISEYEDGSEDIRVLHGTEILSKGNEC